MVFNLQLLAEIFECVIVKLLYIVRDKNSRDIEAANNAFLDEASDILLGDSSQGFYFYPFGEVIDFYDEELKLPYRHKEGSHDVESPLSEGPWSIQQSELF